MHHVPEFEIHMSGHTLVRFSEGGLKINGQDFHTDIRNLSSLISILSEALTSIDDVRKPRLVAEQKDVPVMAMTPPRNSALRKLS